MKLNETFEADFSIFEISLFKSVPSQSVGINNPVVKA